MCKNNNQSWQSWSKSSIVLLTLLFWVTVFVFLSSNASADTWVSNSSIKSGLGDHGSDSTLTVFYYDGSFKLISGWGPGTFAGYNWTGSSWSSYSVISNGLPDVGYVSAPSVFLDGSTLKLISGEQDGVLNGYYYSGDTWISDSSIINGTSSVGLKSKPCVFYHDSMFKMIVGESDGVFNGYYWGGLSWISDSDIISGLPDVGERSTPCVFYDGGTLKLISGEFSGVFNGFYWSGSTWVSDSDIVSGLPDVGSDSAPFVFLDGDVLKLISGEENGLFYGYTSGYTPPPPTDCYINFNPDVSISNQTQQYFNYSVNDTYKDYMYFVTSVWHAPYNLSDLYLIENWLNVEQEGENIQLNNPFSDLQTYHLNLYATTSAPPVVSESFLIASSNEIYINRSYASSIPPIPDPEPDPDPYEPDPNPIEDPDIPIPDDWNMTIPEKYQNVSWLTNYTGYFDDMRYSINGSLYGITGLVIKPLQSLNETVYILRYHIANSTNMVAELSYLSVIVYYGWGVLPVEMQTIFIGVAAAGACIYLFKRRT